MGWQNWWRTFYMSERVSMPTHYSQTTMKLTCLQLCFGCSPIKVKHNEKEFKDLDGRVRMWWAAGIHWTVFSASSTAIQLIILFIIAWIVLETNGRNRSWKKNTSQQCKHTKMRQYTNNIIKKYVLVLTKHLLLSTAHGCVEDDFCVLYKNRIHLFKHSVAFS